MMLLRPQVIIGLTFIAATALALEDNSGNSSQPVVNYRLPDNVLPVHYNIKLIPYIVENNFTFNGESNINIVIRSATLDLRLHATELTIDEIATSLVNYGGVTHTPKTHNYENVTQILIIEFDNELAPGHYTLNLKFVGILNDDTEGFFRTWYQNEEDDRVWLAATHFEATSARRAFPCWDEPALKATFNISIKHHRNYTALSNMPALPSSSENDEDDMIWTHFDTTPNMSTYLVAFVVADYVRVPNADGTINMWCRPKLVPYSTFAQQIAQRSGELLTQYTNSTKKVPKMDHVASPKYLYGAMENWGLIIYNEKDFAYDEEQDTTKHKHRIAIVAAHEMAHQWFGNIVSPSWWTHVWLSEGFASFFEAYFLDKIFHDWRMDIFVIEKQHSAFHLDIDKEVMPILTEVNTPEEIASLFYISSYGKAPVILRMLQHTITDKVFRNGVIKYLKTHQFQSAASDDLWNAFQTALDESNISHNNYTLKEVMDTWITQRHYPVVRVIRNYDTGEAILKQEHYHPYVPDDENHSTNDDKWWIPITFTTQTNFNFSNTMPTHWLRPQDQSITINGINSEDWLIVNLQQMGYYLVNYDEANWQKIANYLDTDNYTKIHVLNRAQIINDAYHLLMANQLKITTFLDIISYMQKETEYVPWHTMFLIFSALKDVFQIPGGESLKLLILAMLNGLVENVGYEERPTESDFTKIKRVEALKWACNFGHTECKRMAAAKLNEHLANPETNKVSPNLKEWIFCNGIMNANVSTWYNLMDVHRKNPAKGNILQYLCCSEYSEIIIDYLKKATTDNTTLIGDYYYKIYFEVIERHANKDIIRNYLLANLEQVTSRHIGMKNAIYNMIRNVHSEQKLDQINKFMINNYEKDEELLKFVQEEVNERKSKLLRTHNIFIRDTN